MLTYQNKTLNSPLASGSYLLSGYIDFLISEKAYFYYSPHYNRIRSTSGDYRGEPLTNYMKRFFFTLVYSDDSDDTYFTISENNGTLWALSDYISEDTDTQSVQLEDIKNSYFIGSNQTIFYGNETNDYVLDTLSNSIYYIGCSDSTYYQEYSVVTDIKHRGRDKHTYSFGFNGGGVKYFYLDNDTFSTEIEETKEFIQKQKEIHVIIIDTSDGKSSIIPSDNTTQTYIYNYVTNETTPEEDEKHTEKDRNPFTSDKDKDDTSNWSIWDFLKGIFEAIGELAKTIGSLVSDLISGLISLIVPSGDFFSSLFDDLQDWFSLKLGFIFYPFELIANILGRIANIEYANPVLNIPDICEPLTGEILFHAVTFNFNDLLEEHESFQTMHNIYLTIVDVIIIFSLVNLLRKKFEEVTMK